jgi:hypothetical protein
MVINFSACEINRAGSDTHVNKKKKKRMKEIEAAGLLTSRPVRLIKLIQTPTLIKKIIKKDKSSSNLNIKILDVK